MIGAASATERSTAFAPFALARRVLYTRPVFAEGLPVPAANEKRVLLTGRFAAVAMPAMAVRSVVS
jgi:hypothetical protein